MSQVDGVHWTANPPLRLECGERHPDVLIQDVMLIVVVALVRRTIDRPRRERTCE